MNTQDSHRQNISNILSKKTLSIDSTAAVGVGVDKGVTSVIENSQVTGTGSSDTSASQNTLQESALATPTVNCNSSTCSSTPTDPVTIAVPSTSDGVVVVTTGAAGVAVG